MKIILIVGFVIVIILVVNWLSKSQIGTLTFFHATIRKRLQSGDAPLAANRYALNQIAHRPPIGQLTETESARVAEVFSQFRNSQDVNTLLKEALVTGRVEVLREPNISRLENVGREKGLTVE